MSITTAAAAFNLPPVLVEAIILVESGGDPAAYNPEPKYRYFWDVRHNRPFRKVTDAEIDDKTPPADFPMMGGDRDQEWWGQQASWGLMQTMGAVARQHGFMGTYLVELADPDKSIHYGCAHLHWLWGRFYAQYGWPGVVAAYNAGSPRKVAGGGFENQGYVEKVRGKMAFLGHILPQRV